jgi:hypothetical protein
VRRRTGKAHAYPLGRRRVDPTAPASRDFPEKNGPAMIDVSTPPRLKSCGFWANPSSEELSVQGPAPILGTPRGSGGSLVVVVDVLREGLPLPTGTTKFPKSRTRGSRDDRVGTLAAKPAVCRAASPDAVASKITKGVICYDDLLPGINRRKSLRRNPPHHCH